MKAREFGVLIVRLFAVWMIFQGVLSLEQLGISVFAPWNDEAGTKKYLLFVYFSQMMLYFIVGVALGAKTDSIIDLIMSSKSDTGETLHIEKQEMAILSYSLAGFYLLVTGLQSFIYQSVSWYFYPKPSFAPNMSQYKFDKPALFVSLFSISFGTFLVVTPGGFLRLFRWFRGMGHQTDKQA